MKRRDRKGHLRIAIASEDDGSPVPRSGPRYLHVACVSEHVGEDPDTFIEQVQANSKNVEAKDMKELEAAVNG